MFLNLIVVFTYKHTHAFSHDLELLMVHNLLPYETNQMTLRHRRKLHWFTRDRISLKKTF